MGIYIWLTAQPPTFLRSKTNKTLSVSLREYDYGGTPKIGCHLEYCKRPNKRPGRLLGCSVGEEGEGAFIKTIYELG